MYRMHQKNQALDNYVCLLFTLVVLFSDNFWFLVSILNMFVIPEYFQRKSSSQQLFKYMC